MKKKIISFVCASLVFSGILFTPLSAYADYWGASLEGTIVGEALTKLREYTKNTLLGRLKVSAYQFLSQQITSIISGVGKPGGGAQFIQNWENYMYTQAGNTTRLAINDFFTMTLRGTGSSSSYVSAGASSGFGTQSHAQQLQKRGEAAVSTKVGKYTLDQYCTDPFEMFGGGDLECFVHYFDPFNNDFAYPLEVQKKYAEILAKEEEIAKTKAIAGSGFPGVEDKKTGQTMTPGTVIKGIFTSLNDQLIKLPAQATSPEEIATMTAGTFINSLMKQAMQQGLARVQNEVYTRASQKINEGIRQAVGRLGPVGQFLDYSGSTAAIQQGTNRWLLGTGR